MKPATRRVVWGGAAAAAVLLGWQGYQRLYRIPTDELSARIGQVRKEIEEREAESDRLPGLRKRLGEIASTTLARSEEGVAAAMRTALNEIAAECRLDQPTVTTREPVAIKSPASKAGELSSKSARAQADFYAVEATVQAVGSMDAVIRAVATLDHQKWVHRIDRWGIRPVDKARERFELSVQLTTLMMPDVAPATEIAFGDGRVWEPLADEQFARYRPILANANFREPPAVRGPEAPAVASVAPASPAYEDWKVTAVVRGRHGWELWLANGKSGQQTSLTPGSRVLDATFVDAAGEDATIEIEGTRYVVELGRTLADRRPAVR
ncbi:MAG: hypothetical protein KF745_10060 [Phycisphaeraceae bacterium]|nr:hypothetical protein [Phycisphaeraceae bacterium]